MKNIIEKTPKSMMCVGLLACPAIFKNIQERTPKEMACIGVLACPAVFEHDTSYLIIGKVVNPLEYGIEKRIGEDEVLIEVPTKLIDLMEK